MVKKRSAGLLVFRQIKAEPEVLLVHPGGPYWRGKDQGAWSIPKGEYEENENALEAARREFEEEIGFSPPKGRFIDLGEVHKPQKIIKAWAIEGDFDVSVIKSNVFDMEWPPHSARTIQLPEIDKAEWFLISNAGAKLHKGLDKFIARLSAFLANPGDPP